MKCSIKYLPAVIFICFFFPGTVHSDGRPIQFGEIGRLPVSEGIHFRIEAKNDSYSMLSRTDWDDLRSFGMYYGLSFSQWAIEITNDSLTNRSTSIETGSRIDQLSLSVSHPVLKSGGGFLSYDLSAGAEVFYFGNLGMKGIQNTAHVLYGSPFEIPARYDNPEKRFILAGNAILCATFDTPVVPVYFFSTLEAGHTGFLRTASYLESGISDDFLEIRFSGGFQWSREYLRSGNTFARVLHSETGLYAGAVFRAGFLETGFTYNLTTTRQAGYASLTFSNEKKGDKIGENEKKSVSAIEFRLFPLIAAVRLQRSIRTYPLTVSPMLGAESGPFMESTTGIPITEHYRYEQLYAGLDIAYPAFPWMDVYLAAALGVRKDIWTTRTIVAARILAESNSALWFAEGGLRLFLPSDKPGRHEWGLGAAFGVLYVNALETGFRSGLRLYLVASTGRKHP